MKNPQFIKNFIAQLSKLEQRFSSREKLLIIFGALAIFIVVLTQGIKSARASFEELEISYLKSKMDLEQASGLLKNYQRLKLKRDEIEKEYEKIEFKEGALSYIDTLVKQKLGDSIKQSFNITPRPPQPFGLNFELSPFSVKFTVPSLENLTSFLKEAVSGSNPMFITKLDMTKNYKGDGLDVEVELSCIQKATSTKDVATKDTTKQ